ERCEFKSTTHSAISSGEPCVGEWSTTTTKYRTLNFKEDSFVHVSCKYRDLKVDGEEVIKCVGGQLPTYLPQCVLRKSSCPSLKAPILGSMKCSTTAPEVGSSCTFACQNTHYLKGTSTRICTEDLRWSGSAARCIMKTECSEPFPLHQGTVTGCSPQRKPKYDDTCYFRCNEGFRLVGPSQLKCRLDGRLTDEKGREIFPRCEPFVPTNPPASTDIQSRPRPISPTSWLSCQVSNGYCSHNCHREPKGIRCSCRSGYRLADDGKTCFPFVPTNPPANAYIQNRPRPISPTSWLSCQVSNGYCSHNCHQEQKGIRCSCRSGYRLADDGKNCFDVDECQDETLNKCDHHCRNTEGSYHCLCRQGYTSSDGFRCERRIEVPAYVTPDDEDFRNTPRPDSPHPGSLCRVQGYCSHYCHQEIEGIRCSCRSGYQLYSDGRTCFDVDECQDETLNKCDHHCRNTVGSYHCLCRQGYTSQDGFRCERISPISTINSGVEDSRNTPRPVAATSRFSCEKRNGNCSQLCHQELRGVRCSCRSGYRLAPDGRTCRDVDECSDDKLNKCDHTCRNTKGGYICNCREGFVSPDGFRCEGCRVNSYRSTTDITCKECPFNSHTDGEEKTSINDCICNSGFTGNPGRGIPCTDIDECADGDNFGCSHRCVNTPGSAHCSCPPGYELKEDGKTCIDIDECSIKNGGCDGICHNTIGNFTCSCPEGYVASPDDRYSCDDVNECAEGNGGCSGKCANFKGGFHCFCSEGYHLHPDGKSCIPVYCPRVFVPHHSNLRCKNSMKNKDKNTYRPGEMPEDKEFPVGAVCRIKCDKGYDFQDSHSGIVCQNDGKWNATLPECRVLQCPPLSPPLNGDVYPSSCKEGSSTVKEKCIFTCQPGYRITGQETLTCQNNLTWAKKKPTLCVPETEVSISCPDDDITIELTPDEGWAEMQLNSPRTTLAAGPIRVSPEWVTLDRASVFPAGETEVTFSVTSGNKTAECSISVIVLDKHPPVFPDCPDTLSVTSSLGGTAFNWEEPVPQDNVGIASVSKSLEPDSILSSGLHFVEYVARDFAGNVGQCIFHINVTATGGCNDLADPENGEANCQEWMFGKICQPTCFDNYTRPPELFACDESGTWAPSDFISPCLP
ncbi:unnamed protein product, partial [Larinioides sclopetarius]